MTGESEHAQLVAELASAADRIYKAAGPHALAASARAVTLAAGAALPPESLNSFIRSLVEAVAIGANLSGHEVYVLEVARDGPTGAVN